jgi:hypothetical protein
MDKKRLPEDYDDFINNIDDDIDNILEEDNEEDIINGLITIFRRVYLYGDRLHNNKYNYDKLYRKLEDKLDFITTKIFETIKQDRYLYELEYVNNDGNGETAYATLSKNFKDAKGRINLLKAITGFAKADKDSWIGEIDTDYGMGDADENYLKFSTSASSGTGKITKKVDKPKNNNAGAYFPYLNKSNIDLSRYQIYTKKKLIEKAEHCFIHCLRLSGYADKIDLILSGLGNDGSFFTGNIPSSIIKRIAKDLNVCIKISKYHDNKQRDLVYNSNGNDEIRMALHMEHYFLFEQTNIKRDKFNRHTSLSLIKHLQEQGKFEYVLSLNRDLEDPKIVFSTSEQKPFDKLKEVKIPETILYADTEAYFKNNKHIPFLFQCRDDNNFKIEATNTNTFFCKIYDKYKDKKEIVMYYHNLRYDWFLIRDCENITHTSSTIKAGSYYKVNIKFNDLKIELRDSAKLIAEPLKRFSGMFGLGNSKKEYIMYKLYRDSNAFRNSIILKPLYDYNSIKTVYDSNCKEIAKPEEYALVSYYQYEDIAIHKTIIENIFKDGSEFIKSIDTPLGNYRYYHIDHYRWYLDYDCIVLRDGLTEFRKQMKDILGIDPASVLTISSLVHRKAIEEGCYEDIYNVYGGLQTFIQKAAFGGRVATAYNTKHYHRGRVEDFDGVSLYPSAIYRLCQTMGLPKGQAKKLLFDPIDKDYSYYVVEIEILEHSKPQQIAFPCILTKGKRTYTNKVKGERVIIDMITLQDWIEFCDLKYRFIRGVYWDEGYNNKLGNLVKTLFDERLKAKKENNNCKQTMLKLCLNSLYGKTLIKRSSSKQVTVPKYKYEKYLVKNFDMIKKFEHHGSSTVFTLKNYAYDHSNTVHCGAMILSMSKRIMNEVMSVAEDNNIEILYQDTDSMHIVHDDCESIFDKNGVEVFTKGAICTLETEFRNKYGRELIGKNLGQFHCDFEIGGAKNIYAKETIILGKKCYYDRMISNHQDGLNVEDDKITFKGISEQAFYNKASEYKDGASEVFRKLYDGHDVVFNLAGPGCISWNMDSNGINIRDEFNRRAQYKWIF